MQKPTKVALVILLFSLAIAPPGSAEDQAKGAQPKQDQAEQDRSKQEMRSLDEQVQQVKTDVLSIAADLSRLEEKLLYPSNTQVAIFVSIAEGQKFRLDAMKINIDGRPATRYVYAYKELEALQKGGVQRIYTGNLPTGKHSLEVSVNGATQGGRDFDHTESFPLSKGIEPKLVGITLAGPETIQVADW